MVLGEAMLKEFANKKRPVPRHCQVPDANALKVTYLFWKLIIQFVPNLSVTLP
jgi:hypothetical protein